MAWYPSLYAPRTVPGLRRVAILAHVGMRAAMLEMGEAETAARTFGLPSPIPP